MSDSGSDAGSPIKDTGEDASLWGSYLSVSSDVNNGSCTQISSKLFESDLSVMSDYDDELRDLKLELGNASLPKNGK